MNETPTTPSNNPASKQATLWDRPFSIPGDSNLFNPNRLNSDITANYHRGNVHSEAAHRKARHGADKAKQAILAALACANEASCEQLETLTGLRHQTCSARISELKRDGEIVKSATT